MGAVTTTALYPNTPGKHFDLEYYLNKHMPYAEKIWGPLGMKKWTVTSFKNAEDGQAAPYRLKAVCEWTSLDDLKSAVGSAEGKVVFEDGVNFTDEAAVLLVGETEGSSGSA